MKGGKHEAKFVVNHEQKLDDSNNNKKVEVQVSSYNQRNA